MSLTVNGNSLSDLMEWKKLPKIKDERVQKAKFCGAYGYSVSLPDGNTEFIVGDNAHARTLKYLRGLI